MAREQAHPRNLDHVLATQDKVVAEGDQRIGIRAGSESVSIQGSPHRCCAKGNMITFHRHEDRIAALLRKAYEKRGILK